MEELKVHIQHVMLWEFKNNKNATRTAKKICSVYGQGDITDCKRGMDLTPEKHAHVCLACKSENGRSNLF